MIQEKLNRVIAVTPKMYRLLKTLVESDNDTDRDHLIADVRELLAYLDGNYDVHIDRAGDTEELSEEQRKNIRKILASLQMYDILKEIAVAMSGTIGAVSKSIDGFVYAWQDITGFRQVLKILSQIEGKPIDSSHEVVTQRLKSVE